MIATGNWADIVLQKVPGADFEAWSLDRYGDLIPPRIISRSDETNRNSPGSYLYLLNLSVFQCANAMPFLACPCR